jgi:hypothetical protein
MDAEDPLGSSLERTAYSNIRGASLLQGFDLHKAWRRQTGFVLGRPVDRQALFWEDRWIDEQDVATIAPYLYQTIPL